MNFATYSGVKIWPMDFWITANRFFETIHF